MLAVETMGPGEHSYLQKEISALGGGSTRGREVLGLTLGGGLFWGRFPGGAAAYPVSSLCPIHPGKHWQEPSMGLQVPLLAQEQSWAQSCPKCPQHTLWAQDSLAPALPLALLRPPPTAHTPFPRPQSWPPCTGPGSGGNCLPQYPYFHSSEFLLLCPDCLLLTASDNRNGLGPTRVGIALAEGPTGRSGEAGNNTSCPTAPCPAALSCP